MTDPVREALAHWGLDDAPRVFVAGRENRVYRVTTPDGDCALRLRRPGYRSEAELASELMWLAAMDKAGLSVPRPVPSRRGRLLERAGGGLVDLVGWLPGRPLGKGGEPLALGDAPGTFRALGAELARLHLACDAWHPPEGFTRCRWDAEGLLGEAPLWGRFWDNPTLDPGTRQLFLRFRHVARDRLGGAESLDYGLIHADPVRENVLVDGAAIRLIDFDDGGHGHRAFDLATVLVRLRDEPGYRALKAALIAGYRSRRALDLAHLDLFLALRALSYVGWIVPRMAEPGASARNRRFVAAARTLCAACLEPAEHPRGE